MRRTLLTPILAAAALVSLLPGCGGAPRPRTAATSLTSASARCQDVRFSAAGLDLVVLGSGGPRSAGRAASSHLIGIDGKARFLVDAGPGAFARLGETHLDAEELDTFLLTHLHIDHAGDVAGLVKSRDLMGTSAQRFRFFGPDGRGPYPSTTIFVDRLFGAAGAFAYLPSFRNELSLESTNLPLDLAAGPKIILQENGTVISSVAVDHDDVPAVAYRIEHRGHSVVVTGDLASKRGRIEDLARGADVLVYDTAVLDPPGSPKNLYELHTPPSRIGQVAAAVGAKQLILAHVAPGVDEHRDEVLASVRAAYHGDVRFASDCMHLAIGEER